MGFRPQKHERCIFFISSDFKFENESIHKQKSVCPSWKNGHLTPKTLKIMCLGSNTYVFTWKVQFLHQGWWQISFGIYSERKNGDVPPKNGYLTPRAPWKCTFLQNRSKTDLLLAIFCQGKLLGLLNTTCWRWSLTPGLASEVEGSEW